MENSISIHGVRCYIDENNVAQLDLEDVSRGLGFTRIAESGNEVVRWETVRRYLIELKFVPASWHGKLPEYIPENIFYRLSFKAKNEKAESFQTKVADVILPSIRKTGGYIGNGDLFVDTYLAYADEKTKTLFKSTLETVRKQNELLQEQRQEINRMIPKVEFYDTVRNAKGCHTIGEVAKILGTGRTRLFDYLRKRGVLCTDNTPKQYHKDLGYFEVIENPYKCGEGKLKEERLNLKTLITGKGLIWLRKFIDADSEADLTLRREENYNMKIIAN